MEFVKSNDELGVLPAANDTIIVSPNALEIANTIDAMMPDVAAGTITLRATSNLVAPIPKAPSRTLFGTEDIASSLILEMSGIIMMPTTIPGLMELKLLISGKIDLSKGVTKVKAKNPKTIVGIPDNNSKVGLMILRAFFEAYSLRYIAEPKPIGTATIVAMTVIFSVPMISAQIPYFGDEVNGDHSAVNRNSVSGMRVKNVIVSVSNVTNMPSVVRIEISAMSASTFGTTLSLVTFAFDCLSSIILLTLICGVVNSIPSFFCNSQLCKKIGKRRKVICRTSLSTQSPQSLSST